MRINRQTVLLGVRFILVLAAIGANVYVWDMALTTRITVFLLSLLTVPLFSLFVVGVCEPMRLKMIIRKTGEEPVIQPHLAWYVHRESRLDWCNVPGTLALTDRTLRFVSSPLYTNEDINTTVSLPYMTHLTDNARDQKPGHYLIITLRDGAKLKLKLRLKSQHTHWMQELRDRIVVMAKAA